MWSGSWQRFCAFEGDLLDAVATCERKIMIYEAQSHEAISDSLKIGFVFAEMSKSSTREHLVLSATKCDSWQNFVREVETIEHAKRITTAPTPMEIDAFISRSLPQVRKTLPKNVGVRSKEGKPQCAKCGKRLHGQCWTRSHPSTTRESPKGGRKGGRKEDVKGTQKGGKSKGGTGGEPNGKATESEREINVSTNSTARRTMVKWILGTVARTAMAD